MSGRSLTSDDTISSITLNSDRSARYVHLDSSSYTKLRPAVKANDEIPQRRRRVSLKSTADSRTCTWCIYGITFLVVLLSLVSFVISGKMLYNILFNIDEQVEFCLPYEEVKGEQSVDLFTKKVMNDKFMYCVHTPSEIEALLETVIEKKTQKFGKEIVTKVSQILKKGEVISAHALLNVSKQKNARMKDNLYQVRLLKDRSLSHGDGVQLGYRQLIIIIKGTYYLYSQTYFKVIPGLNVNYTVTSVPLQHTVNLYRVNSPFANGHRKLLNNVNWVFIKGRDYHFRSSFVSGTFNLDSGDEIFVTVSNLDLIARQPETNFVGLFLLG